MTTSGPTHSNPATDLVSVNQLNDYSYLTEDLFALDTNGVLLRCASGLGPTGGQSNLGLGGWFYDGVQIGSGDTCDTDFQNRGANARNFPGIINLYPCGPLPLDEEGVYSCMIMNSSMMVQTTRVGLYLSGRSESLDMYPITSLLIIFHLSTQLLQ